MAGRYRGPRAQPLGGDARSTPSPSAAAGEGWGEGAVAVNLRPSDERLPSLRPGPAAARHVRARPRHGAGVVRVDRRLDRDADDHRRPRRPAALLVGLLRLPADLDRHDADLRPARRHLRPAPHPPDRDLGLPRRRGRLRLRDDHAAPHRRARGPGPRRRGARARRAHRLGRPLLAQGARPRAGPLLGRLGLREPRRAAARRVDDHLVRLALDLHDQRARSGSSRSSSSRRRWSSRAPRSPIPSTSRAA